MADNQKNSYSVLILVVSDTVSRGEKIDRSGSNLNSLLKSGTIFPSATVFCETVADDFDEIRRILEHWTDDKDIDLILSVGGTGFTPRDITPEVTKAVIDREAPHLAAHMILSCREKSKFSVLSRSVCGVRKRTLILNLPGSVKGSEECFTAVSDIIPHALDQLKSRFERVSMEHAKVH